MKITAAIVTIFVLWHWNDVLDSDNQAGAFPEVHILHKLMHTAGFLMLFLGERNHYTGITKAVIFFPVTIQLWHHVCDFA